MTKKKSGCKKKLRKCCTKNQLEALGKKKAKKCCCFPGGRGSKGNSDTQTRGDDGWRDSSDERSSLDERRTDERRTDERSGRRSSTRRTRDLSTRDIGDAMMGGLSASIGGSVAGGIR